MKLFLNFGHGGNDGGATGNGLVEKKLTAKIGGLIYDMLKEYEVNIRKFQQSGIQGLSHITNEANKWGADYFLSIHINAGGGTGFESFIYNGNVSDKTRGFQDSIHKNVVTTLKKYGLGDRGKKKANFHVLRESKMPAVLTENLFIDTKKDSKFLKDNAFLKDIAQGHVNGIVKHLNLKKKKVTSDDSSFYRVVAGSFNNKRNADKQVKKLKSLGFDSFIDVYKK